MIEILIEKTKYKVFTEYSEITHNRYCQLCDLIIPDCLQTVYKSKSEQEYKENWDKITEEQLRLDIALFVGDLIKIFSDIPETLIDAISYIDRMNLYHSQLEKLVIDFVRGYPANDFDPTKRQSFIWNGKVYNLPKTLKIFGKVVPGYGATALQFTEANDVFKLFSGFKNEGIKRFNEVVAVYCNTKSESGFDIDKVSEKAELFKELTMDVIWDVFFCIQKLLIVESKYMRIYLSVQEQQLKMRLLLNSLDWHSFKRGFLYLKWLSLEYMVAKKKLKNYRYILSLKH